MKLEMRSENTVRKTDLETIPSRASLREMVDYVNEQFHQFFKEKPSDEKKNFLLV